MGIYDDPANASAPVTPNNTVNLPATSRSLRVGTTAGDVAVEYTDGRTDVIPNVQVGEIIPVRAAKVLLTGTTAVGITTFW